MDLAEQLPVVLIHYHDAILARNEHAVPRRVRDDVVQRPSPPRTNVCVIEYGASV